MINDRPCDRDEAIVHDNRRSCFSVKLCCVTTVEVLTGECVVQPRLRIVIIDLLIFRCLACRRHFLICRTEDDLPAASHEEEPSIDKSHLKPPITKSRRKSSSPPNGHRATAMVKERGRVVTSAESKQRDADRLQKLLEWTIVQLVPLDAIVSPSFARLFDDEASRHLIVS